MCNYIFQVGDQGANIKLSHAEFIDKGQLSGDSVLSVLAWQVRKTKIFFFFFFGWQLQHRPNGGQHRSEAEKIKTIYMFHKKVI